MIPYQKVTDFDSLNIRPDNNEEFFKQEDFYSTLKEKNISEGEHENVKKFFRILRLKTLRDMSKIYNFQDMAILCEIFEKRASLLQQLFKYNPRKCNSASAFSGCVQILKSKCCIVLPVDAEMIRVFKKTLIGAYSFVNTRLAFDTDIFLKDAEREKVLFKIENGQLKKFSSKNIKIDEKKQYGMAMTKPLPYGCIKRKNKVLSINQLTELLKTITLEDKIRHLFTVDIEFFEVNEKTLLFNEIYAPIFEKKKKISPRERSTSQIMSHA